MHAIWKRVGFGLSAGCAACALVATAAALAARKVRRVISCVICSPWMSAKGLAHRRFAICSMIAITVEIRLPVVIAICQFPRVRPAALAADRTIHAQFATVSLYRLRLPLFWLWRRYSD